MDEVERRIAVFDSYRGPSATAWKLDALLDLCALRDRRVVAFLVTVLADAAESLEVRLDVLNRLRGFDLGPPERLLIATEMIGLLGTDVDPSLRMHTASALGDFADVPSVIGPLGALAISQRESFDLRYAAFASIERAGPTPEVIALLRTFTSDELLGRAAASMLQAWHSS